MRRGKRLPPVCLKDEGYHSREWRHQQRCKEDFPVSEIFFITGQNSFDVFWGLPRDVFRPSLS